MRLVHAKVEAGRSAGGAVAGGMQFVLISTELGVTPWAAIKICINKFYSSV